MNKELEIEYLFISFFNEYKRRSDKKYNCAYKPISGSDVEKIHACMYNTRCSGSGGLGWDTIDKGESKYCNWVQSRNCNNCKEKVMFFLESCPSCKSINLKNIQDSRWSINAKTHNKYLEKLRGYRLALLEPSINNPKCDQFRFRSWFIETKNKYLEKYANAQLTKSKSPTINFMPMGRDFYYSNPCLHLDVTINIKQNNVKINYFNIENTISEDIPGHLVTDESTDDIMSKKHFGKDRGKLERK